MPSPRRFPLPVKFTFGVGGFPGGDKVTGVDINDELLSGNVGEPEQEDGPK